MLDTVSLQACTPSPACSLARSFCCTFSPSLRYHLLNLSHQSRTVIRNPVLDRPFDSAGVRGLAVFDLIHARRIEHLQVLERISVHHDQVSQVTRAYAAE